LKKRDAQKEKLEISEGGKTSVKRRRLNRLRRTGVRKKVPPIRGGSLNKLSRSGGFRTRKKLETRGRPITGESGPKKAQKSDEGKFQNGETFPSLSRKEKNAVEQDHR